MLIANRLRSATEEANIKVLQAATPNLAYLMPTATGLSKSIMDAVTPFREFVRDAGIHDYAIQQQGEDHKRRVPARIFTDTAAVDVTASLYRPQTKQGDPRIWFTQLGRYVAAGDLLAVFAHEGMLHVVDVTTSRLHETTAEDRIVASPLTAQVVDGDGAVARSGRRRVAPDAAPHGAPSGAGRATNVRRRPFAKVSQDRPATKVLEAIWVEEQRDALDLLDAIREIARRGRAVAIGHGDTAVGRTLETLLLIAANSSKLPDWRGKIEIKSSRGGRGNRKNLFAQVPNWTLSGCKSSADILDRFGYERAGSERKLYNTSSATRYNAQGLRLQFDGSGENLLEVSVDPSMPVVAVWPLASLRDSLRRKHAETFWVEADSEGGPGGEEFTFRRIVHTRSPVIAQFEPLVAAGHITLDHLIKRVQGRVLEKGPLFKIDDAGLALLFPPPLHYDL